MDATRSHRSRASHLLYSLFALTVLLLVSADGQARRISIDFGESTETGDAWAFDSTGCGTAGSTLEHSCGVSFAGLNGTTAAVKLGFSVKIGDETYDELFINKYGFVTFGIPFAIADDGFVAASDLAGVQAVVTPVQNRPFIAPFYSNLTLPDRDLREFTLRLLDPDSGQPIGDFVGGVSYYRATSDPTPSEPAERVPAFAVTWVDLDSSPDPIYTQIVLYKNGDNGDFFLRFRYGRNTAGGDEDQYNSSVVQGVAGFSLETLTASDTVALSNPLGGLVNGVPKDYFFSIVNGHVAAVTTGDTDGDGVSDANDNCPTVKNANQADQDHDGIGNLCDSDRDGDGVANPTDNCPSAPNANQADLDGDGRGDACDGDRDGDGIKNGLDNCPNSANPGQEDADHDGIGDVCDTSATSRKCDVDADTDIDTRDLNAIRIALGTAASGPSDPRDFDGNGTIQSSDLKQCRALCTRASCATQ
jgi:Thrombospondin type 3 repeat